MTSMNVRSAPLVLALVAVTACSPAGLVDVHSPSGIVQPEAVNTTDAAKQLYVQAITAFARGYAGANGFLSQYATSQVMAVAAFTDEMQKIPSVADRGVDERTGAMAMAYGG